MMLDVKPAFKAVAYTIRILYIKPLKIHAITVLLDKEYKSVSIQ